MVDEEMGKVLQSDEYDTEINENLVSNSAGQDDVREDSQNGGLRYITHGAYSGSKTKCVVQLSVTRGLRARKSNKVAWLHHCRCWRNEPK